MYSIQRKNNYFEAEKQKMLLSLTYVMLLANVFLFHAKAVQRYI